MARGVLAWMLSLALFACTPVRTAGAPAPAREVPPFRNQALVVYLNLEFGGRTVYDSTGADVTESTRQADLALIESALADLGRADGNTFSRVFRPDDPTVNFAFYFDAQYDNTQARWAGTGKVEYRGYGDVAVLHSAGQTSPDDVLRDLVTQDYQLVHGGWHQIQ